AREESGWIADHLDTVDSDLADVDVDVVNGFVNETRRKSRGGVERGAMAQTGD
ncbi:MAG: hypothetical protein JWR48_7585, partial [Mycobacterium sp.]|nr:hypothetical protein [Mycobacterium sp.]